MLNANIDRIAKTLEKVVEPVNDAEIIVEKPDAALPPRRRKAARRRGSGFVGGYK
jgi:hypothetical protein